MKCRQMKELYQNGELGKREYAQKIFEKHEGLLEYQELVADADCVEKVTIGKDGVAVTVANKDHAGKKYTVDMYIFEKDFSAVPVQMLNFGWYEPDELEMVVKICKILSGMSGREIAFFDVGANLGWYTLNVCRQFANIHSYAFEPVEETYSRMRKNIQKNGIVNCDMYRMGLSDRTEKRRFFFDVSESGASSMVNIRENQLAVETECDFMRLDEFVGNNQIKHMDFIKCDVEGSELFVFQGGIKSIEIFKPVIFSEMLRRWAGKFGYHPNDIICLLKDIGYKCYVLNGRGGLKGFGRVTEDTVETNYFFLHGEAHSQLINELVRS